MMENMVLLIFQGVTGCRSLAVKEQWRVSGSGERSLDCSPMITLFSFLVWSRRDVEG